MSWFDLGCLAGFAGPDGSGDAGLPEPVRGVRELCGGGEVPVHAEPELEGGAGGGGDPRPGGRGARGREGGIRRLGSNGVQSIIDLLQALVSEILHCLDPKDLGIILCVSNLLNGLATDHIGWKDLYCKWWGTSLGPVLPPPGSWKELFVERELRRKSLMGHFTVEALRGHSEAVRAVILLQSFKLVFTGGYDSVVRMWDMEDGMAIATSRPLGNTIRAIAADSKLLVAGGTKGFIQCWRAIEGKPHLFDIGANTVNQNYESQLWGHACIAMDSARIFGGSWDMSVRIWDRTRMKCLRLGVGSGFSRLVCGKHCWRGCLSLGYRKWEPDVCYP